MKKGIPGVITVASIEKLIDELQNDKSITELDFICNDSLTDVTAKILMDYLKTDNNIKTLQLSTRDRPSNDITEELGEMLKVNSGLESLLYYNYDNGSASYSGTALDDALKVNTTLTTLITNHGGGIGEALGVNNTLTKLSVFNTTNEIIAGLKFNKGLTSVSLSGLMDVMIAELSDALSTNSTIKTLGLGTKYGERILTQASGLKLAEGLRANTNIDNLSLSWFGPSAIAEIALILKDTNIATLNINGPVGPLAAKNIATALKDNCALKSLNLSSEANIGIDGYQAIAEALIENNILESISIPKAGNGGVPMGDIGNRTLATILKSNNTLKAINFHQQQITAKDAKAFAEGLEANNTLATLNLGYNRLGSKEGEGTYFFSKALAPNLSLINLDLSGNNLQLVDSQQLGKALKVNKGLKILNLNGNNKLKDPGVKNILDALYYNNSLTSLDVSYCGTTGETAKGAAIVLKDNKVIQKLVLDLTTLYNTPNYNASHIHMYDQKAANLIKKYLDRNNGVVTDEEKQEAVEDRAPLQDTLTVQVNPLDSQILAQTQTRHEQAEEYKEGGNLDCNNSTWEHKYLESKAKNKAKKLELQQQNKALQDELKKAQEDKFNMMMSMFSKLNEDKEAQAKKYEERIERQKTKKQALENKYADAQQMNMTLLMKMITEQKTQADELKGLFREMLGMKDDKIKELEVVNHGNSINSSFLVIDGAKSEEVELSGNGGLGD